MKRGDVNLLRLIAKTPVPENFIQVSLLDILKALFLSRKADSQAVVVRNHLEQLEDVRLQGFIAEGKKYTKVRFMPTEAAKIAAEAKVQIQDNYEDALKPARVIADASFWLSMLIVLLPIIVVIFSIFTLTGISARIIVLILVLMMALGTYASVYLQMLELLAKAYYKDGRLRQTLMQTAGDDKDDYSYDLTIPFL